MALKRFAFIVFLAIGCNFTTPVSSTVLRNGIVQHQPWDTSGMASLNLTGGYNLCLHPVSGVEAVSGSYLYEPWILQHYRRTMQRFRRQVLDAKNSYDNNHDCTENRRVALATMQIRDFVDIRPARQQTNGVTDMYINLAEVAYLLRVLESDRAKDCCINVAHLANKIKTHVLSKWFEMYFYTNGQSIGGENCLFTGHEIESRLFRCSDVRAFVSVILRHTLDKLQDGIDMLEDSINMLHAMTSL